MSGIECGKTVCRERQVPPSRCARGTFHTISAKGKSKTKIIVCCPKGSKLKGGRGCVVTRTERKTGMLAQSLLRPLSSSKCRSSCKVPRRKR